MPSKQKDEIFNIKIKPSLFLEKKNAQTEKLNFIFRHLNIDRKMGDDGKPISHSEKLDMIFKSVKNLTQNCDNLNKKVDNMQLSFDSKIECLKQEVLGNSNKNIQNNGCEQSLVDMGNRQECNNI